jgi:hypothetical protein
MTKKLITLILFTLVLYTGFILGCENKNKSISRVQQKNSPTNNFVQSKSNYIEKNEAKQNITIIHITTSAITFLFSFIKSSLPKVF